MQEFVHTLLSKIDNPLVFKFTKRKEAQFKRVELLNSLKERDRFIDFWDIKDLVGKKQGIMYGRAIYAYYADSINGYRPHLENVDVYDFLIDPQAGGIDIEKARYMGRYGIILTRDEIKEGLKSGIYIKNATEELLAGTGNITEKNQEETNKRVRMYGQNTIGDKELQNEEDFKFWGWFTTYQGKRYYLLLQENGRCIRIEKLTDIFSPTKDFPKGAWPFWTWAAFPDLTEFWTPSYCDYAREIFMAQAISINQLLDNSEAINKPQKAIDITAIENLAELRYRKDGIIKMKGGIDVNRAIQFIRPPAITTPIEVYHLLEQIQEKASGVTAGTKGVEATEGKVSIYQGNQAAEADRFGLLNKSYSFGYIRFALLYEIGIKDHLIKKEALDILGPNGIEMKKISKQDIFKKGDDYNVLVEASNAEALQSLQKQVAKISFIKANLNNPIQNPQKAYEIGALISGFSDDEVKQLTEKEFGNQEIMSEAERDIEAIMEGDAILPNENANIAYKQKLIDYEKDHREDMSDEQFNRLVAYIQSIEQIIIRNAARETANFEIKQINKMGAEPEQPAESIPLNVNKLNMPVE